MEADRREDRPLMTKQGLRLPLPQTKECQRLLAMITSQENGKEGVSPRKPSEGAWSS